MLKKLIKLIYPTLKTKQCWLTFCSTFIIALALLLVIIKNTSVEASTSRIASLDKLQQEVEEEMSDDNSAFVDDDGSDLTQETPENENSKIWVLKSGDTLLKVLTSSGIEYARANDVFISVKKVFNPRNFKVGQKLEIETMPSERGRVLKSMRMAIRSGEYLSVVADEKGNYVSKIEKDNLTQELKLAEGKIDGTLSVSMRRNGVPPRIVAKFISIFANGIDFRRDLKKGDKYELLYETYLTSNGKVAQNGNIVYAALYLGKNKVELYRFKDASGNIDYYKPAGLAMKKTLSRRPMAHQSGRISSYFGRRRHPIYKDVRVHWGVDYPAPKGSLIYAGGDGVVEVAQYRNGYGNYVKIKHNSDYSTAYGHMNGFAKGIRSGVRVKQGQVIGYVGSTGRSTGPHLHYEVLYRGKQVNPLTIKATASENLGGKNLANFKREVAKINASKNSAVAAARKDGKLAQQNPTNNSKI